MRTMNNRSGGTAFMTKTGVAISTIALRNFFNFYAHFNEQTEEGARKDIRSLKGILRKR
jgi:hypothetical protein